MLTRGVKQGGLSPAVREHRLVVSADWGGVHSGRVVGLPVAYPKRRLSRCKGESAGERTHARVGWSGTFVCMRARAP